MHRLIGLLILTSILSAVQLKAQCSIRVKVTNGKYGCLNSKGDIVVPFIYQALELGGNGMLRARMDNKYGMIDTNGKVIIPCMYNNIGVFSNGLASINTTEGNGFINIKNEVAIPCIYYIVTEGFREGRAAVTLKGDKQRKYGYIDTLGNVVIPFIYFRAYSFNNGKALVEDFSYKSGFIGINGDTIIPLIYDAVLHESISDNLDPCDYISMYQRYCLFPEGVLAVKRNHRWGFINENGQEVIDCTFFAVQNFKNGAAEVIPCASEAGPCDPIFIDHAGKMIKKK